MLHIALKQIRLFHQLNQSELAGIFEISRSYLSEIESNKKIISIELLEKYSQFFQIPVSSLLMFSENLNAGKKSQPLRLKCASKILKILEWINVAEDTKNKAILATQEKG